MLEYEKKIIITEKEYEILLGLRCGDSYDFVQTNYYYDTDNFDMNAKGITCRIREKNGEYTATVKAHKSIVKDCSVEISKKVENEYDDTLFVNRNVSLQGYLVTHRTILYFDDDIEIALDKNTYLDTKDFELEIEYSPGQEERAEHMLKYFSGSIDYFDDESYNTDLLFRSHFSKSKSERFFERKELCGKYVDIKANQLIYE